MEPLTQCKLPTTRFGEKKLVSGKELSKFSSSHVFKIQKVLIAAKTGIM